MNKIYIFENLEHSVSDERGWTGYNIELDGSTFRECMNSAYIEECDQDGGTNRCNHVSHYDNEVKSEVREMILREAKIKGRLLDYLIQERDELNDFFTNTLDEKEKNKLRIEIKENQRYIDSLLNEFKEES